LTYKALNHEALGASLTASDNWLANHCRALWHT